METKWWQRVSSQTTNQPTIPLWRLSDASETSCVHQQTQILLEFSGQILHHQPQWTNGRTLTLQLGMNACMRACVSLRVFVCVRVCVTAVYFVRNYLGLYSVKLISTENSVQRLRNKKLNKMKCDFLGQIRLVRSSLDSPPPSIPLGGRGGNI